MDEPILEIKDLELSFGDKTILKNVSFSLRKNKTLSLIGESGSGKTVCIKSILRLNSGATTNGEIIFNNQNLLTLTDKEINKVRGKKIAMIFQNPISSLNPVLTIGKQITEVIQYHQHLDNAKAFHLAIELLSKMKINSPKNKMKEYPHQLSGGMNQRIMIAIALSCEPDILIADEPTSSLDTINQKIVIDILKELKLQNNLSMIFVTHNMNLAKEFDDDIAIMKSGTIIEIGKIQETFISPKHPYTQQLIQCSI